jgi:two-component system, cell cycle sensor histidine kinase and response regulator CckA
MKSEPSASREGSENQAVPGSGESTERHASEMEAAILNALPARIALIDRRGVIVSANERWRQFAGANVLPGPGLVPGQNYLETCEQAYQIACGIRSVLNGASREFSLDYPSHLPGEKRWFRVMVHPVVEVPPGGAVVMHLDVTESKLAEETLREQASLVESMHDAMIVRDLDHRILSWNKGAERLYGWTSQEAMGRSVLELYCKGASEFQQGCNHLAETGAWAGEFQSNRKDGGNLTVESRWTLVRDEAGNAKTIIGIDVDVSDRKKREGRLVRAQRMESIETLAGGMAHDLNNALAPILMSVQLLQDKVKDEASRSLLETLEESAERGASLINQVLSFARGVAGRRVIVRPEDLLRDIAKMIQEVFPKNIDISFVPAHNLWTVTGDPAQLHQVLVNLCLNARDAMPQGGKLTIQMQNMLLNDDRPDRNIECKPGAYAMITVTDTGTGIAPEIRDRIFEPFFTCKEIGRGTGLGLSTALAVIKSHGGFIDVESEPGQGSQFRVFLPANTVQEAAEPAPMKQSQIVRGHGELILVVDDEEGIRTVVQRTLERFGYRVLIAAHGAEAVTLYASHRDEIAVVLTDMAMPVMDGPATIKALRAMNPAIKIIGSSGLDSREEGAGAAGAAVDYFMAKPYTAEGLLSILAQALQKPADKIDHTLATPESPL